MCEKAVDYEFYNTGGTSAEFYGWTAKTANIGTAVREIPYSTFIFGVENTILESSDCLFLFPSDAMLRIKEVEMVAR